MRIAWEDGGVIAFSELAVVCVKQHVNTLGVVGRLNIAEKRVLTMPTGLA